MTDRTGLRSTTLHYLAVQQTMVSVHRPVHSKIMLTTVHPEKGFKLGVIKRQGSAFL